MTDKNHEQDDLSLRRSGNDVLESELDAALAQYALVDPREGLEERILASLQAERARVPERSWLRWSFAAAVAAVIVVAVVLAWRSNLPGPQQIVRHPSPTQQNAKQSPPQAEAKNLGGARNELARTPKASARHLRAVTIALAAANPKLDVFPSPQPLSEQEKLLLSYTHEEPERAALLAEARMGALRRDAEERRALAADRNSRQ